MHFDQHVEAHPPGVVVQHLQLDGAQRGDNQQHRVGARDLGLEQLILGNDEVLSQNRNVHNGAYGREMVQRPVEERGLGQHRDRGRARVGVGRCDRRGIVVGAKDAARRRPPFALGDDIDAIGPR